jgi:tRNA nucleotidyltransferase (CCA-adding enzyme)
MASAQARWEHFPHGADVGIRGIAPTQEEAFQQAALALTAVVADPQSIESRESIRISCESSDRELLLVDWLNALIYEMVTRRLLFGRFEVHLDGPRLKATAWGEPFATNKQELAVEPKGATYTGLSVRQEDNRAWIAECVIDV